MQCDVEPHELFLIGDPHFPKWGMLAFSIGTMWLYWLFLGLMSLFVRLP